MLCTWNISWRFNTSYPHRITYHLPSKHMLFSLDINGATGWYTTHRDLFNLQPSELVRLTVIPDLHWMYDALTTCFTHTHTHTHTFLLPTFSPDPSSRKATTNGDHPSTVWWCQCPKNFECQRKHSCVWHLWLNFTNSQVLNEDVYKKTRGCINFFQILLDGKTSFQSHIVELHKCCRMA